MYLKSDKKALLVKKPETQLLNSGFSYLTSWTIIT